MYSRYRSKYSISAQVNNSRKPRAPERPVAWTADTVWAAAATAYRVNGGEYLKDHEYARDDQGLWTETVLRRRNRDVMKQALDDASMITEQDRDLGARARDWLGKKLLMSTLKGTPMSEFETACQRMVTLEDFDEWNTRYELALVPSQIKSYEEAVQLEAAMEGIRNEPVAPVGDKVDLEITVVKSVYSQNYGVYFITAVTPSKQAVFFSFRERLSNGHQCRIRGTVKAHRENSTQLNRVRVA